MQYWMILQQLIHSCSDHPHVRNFHHQSWLQHHHILPQPPLTILDQLQYTRHDHLLAGYRYIIENFMYQIFHLPLAVTIHRMLLVEIRWGKCFHSCHFHPLLYRWLIVIILCFIWFFTSLWRLFGSCGRIIQFYLLLSLKQFFISIRSSPWYCCIIKPCKFYNTLSSISWKIYQYNWKMLSISYSASYFSR